MTAVIGGGLAGLSASYYGLLNRKLGKIVLLESSDRVGGWMRTLKSPRTKALFEQGPRTIRCGGEAADNTLRLLDRLKLNHMVTPVFKSNPAFSNRNVFVKGQVHVVPNSLNGFFKPKPPFERAFSKMVLQDLFAPKVKLTDESIHSFVSRRFGQDVADYMVGPLICGIFAGDAKSISVKALAKKMFDLEQKHGSVLKGLLISKLREKKSKPVKDRENLYEVAMTDTVDASCRNNWAVWSLEGGLELLPKKLASTLKTLDVSVRLNSPCQKILFENGRAIVTVNNKTESYDRVVAALPAKSTAKLVREQHPQLAELLEEIPMATVAVVNLEYAEDLLENPAFGLLVAPMEGRPILGVTFDSCLFPNDSQSMVKSNIDQLIVNLSEECKA